MSTGCAHLVSAKKCAEDNEGMCTWSLKTGLTNLSGLTCTSKPLPDQTCLSKQQIPSMLNTLTSGFFFHTAWASTGLIIIDPYTVRYLSLDISQPSTVFVEGTHLSQQQRTTVQFLHLIYLSENGLGWKILQRQSSPHCTATNHPIWL